MIEKQKTVGILSMQRVANYGSFLQAWALRQMLRAAGADVYFIDIRPGRQLKGYEFGDGRHRWRRLAELTGALLCGRLGAKMRGRKFYRTMRARYRTEYYAMLGLDRVLPLRLDVAVIGSDQVFNALERTPWGFTAQLFGDIPEADKVVSYAASFGGATLAELQRTGVADEIASNLAHLAAISVRDEHSAELVCALTGREAVRHLDPVLVYDFTAELEGRTSGERDYIVVYSYPERIANRAEIEAIRAFAATRGKRLVSILATYDWCDEAVQPATPFDVLAWFRDADYIVTDTFHGTIFSIITERLFCTLVRDSNASRLSSLLDGLGLGAHAATSSAEIIKILDTKPDYAPVREIIKREKHRAEEYLAEVLGIDNYKL